MVHVAVADGLRMSVLAVGLDVVDVDRIARILNQHPRRAMERLLTDDERRYCQSKAFREQHVAVRVAAKEAAYKALAGDGEGGFMVWRDIEVRREVGGRPVLELRGRARVRAEQLGVSNVLVSLTHTAGHAAAVVILEGDGPGP